MSVDAGHDYEYDEAHDALPSRRSKNLLHIVSMPQPRTSTGAETTDTTRLTISEAEL